MYLVLARKLRPQRFEDVIGQHHVTKTLQNAIAQDRLAHALLFSGPRGVGKTSVARILSKAINCQQGPTPTPCNVCENCISITSGNFPDVMEIDGASNRGIDEIRSLRENCRFRPVAGRFRVYIIDEVHMLTKEAFNALLKTLEEPPEHVFFIMATTEPHKIPATIHSRCQHYEFRRIPIKDLADYLNKIIEIEDLGMDRGCATLIAREADGSIRDSLSLMDQAAAYGVKTVDEMCEAFGLLKTQILEKICIAILKRDMNTILSLLHELHLKGMEPKAFALQLMEYMRDVLMLRILGPNHSSDIIKLSQDEAIRLWPVIQSIPDTLIIQIVDLLTKGLSSLQFSQTPSIALEILLLRITMLQEAVNINELINKLETLLSEKDTTYSISTSAPHSINNDNSKQSSSPTSAAISGYHLNNIPGPSDNAIETKITPHKTNDNLVSFTSNKPDDIMTFIQEKRSDIASLLADCTITHDGNTVTLHFNSPIHCEIIKTSENLSHLEKLFEMFYGSPKHIKIEIQKKQKIDQPDSTSSSLPTTDELKNLPLVQQILRVFDAKIEAVYPVRKNNHD